METFMLLAKIFGISFTSGINLYATVGLVGLAIRFNLVTNLPEQLNILANEYVIGVALVMYTCEFIADKIPAFDSVWDSIHTFIRPFAAAMLALMAAGDSPMIIKIIAMLIAGSVALTSHTAKAGIRLVANTSPEPFSNSILSIAEDIGVFVLVALILTHPYIALVIVLTLMTLIIWQGPKLVGFIAFMFKAIIMKINSYIPSEKFLNIEMMPIKHNNYLNSILFDREQVFLTLSAKFKGRIRGSGYLVLCSERLMLIHKKWFMICHEEYDLPEIKRLSFHENFLTDKITFCVADKQVLISLFKSNTRKLDDVKRIFSSLSVQVIEEEPQISLSKAKTA